MKILSPQAVHTAIINGAQLIDIRSPTEHARMRIDGSHLAPLTELQSNGTLDLPRQLQSSFIAKVAFVPNKTAPFSNTSLPKKVLLTSPFLMVE